MNDEVKKYPVSEIFTSPQGEGVYSGTMMTFIRLAGCTVGKPYPKEMYKSKTTMVSHHDHDDEEEVIPAKFPIYTEECTLYDGRKFACDTDYRVKERLTIDEIMARVPKEIKHICLTGGEPLMHNLYPIYDRSPGMVHIETSGTIDYRRAFPVRNFISDWGSEVWITVSPKFGCLPEMIERADEIKLLVDEKFNPETLPKEIFDHEVVFLNPVNFEHKMNGANLKLCMNWQKLFPQWRVGTQLHKVIQHYTEEIVR